MRDSYWYYGQLRKAEKLFASIFSNLKVARITSEGSPTKIIPVPVITVSQDDEMVEFQNLNYREKGNRYYKELPAITSELTNCARVSSKMRPNRVNELNAKLGVNDISYARLTGIPYDLTFELNIISDRKTDCYQVFEQIAPYFNPSYTVNVKGVMDEDDTLQVPIRWVSESFMDERGDEGRIFTMTIMFNLEWFIFGPVDHGSDDIIKTIHLNFYSNKDNFPIEVLRDERVIVDADPDTAVTHEEVTKYNITIEGNNG